MALRLLRGPWASAFSRWSIAASQSRHPDEYRSPLQLLSAASQSSRLASKSAAPLLAAELDNFMDIPGGRVPFTAALNFVGGPHIKDEDRVPCYRTIDMTGSDVADALVPHALDEAMALRIYTCMAKLQTMDLIFYEAQRQGRFSFYMTCNGEEATVVGSAAALATDDMVFAQYREQGVLLWRGFSLDDFANQLFGNKLEAGKGRQMPIHYGSKELSFQTISSPLATQMPHAVGAAYAMKLSRSPTVAVAYFGEGASSEGDAHAAFNMAATLGAPCVFICRNNGYAISTPSHEQYKGDGVVARGPMYGMAAVRVDGGDARAVYNAVASARALALRDNVPVLVEAMSYRSGHHSTSDDSSRYRTSEEMGTWRARDPVVRFRNWMVKNAWWDEAREQKARKEYRTQVMASLDAAAGVAKPDLSNMFTDVYRDMPAGLREQMQETLAFARRHPEICPPGVALQ